MSQRGGLNQSGRTEENWLQAKQVHVLPCKEVTDVTTQGGAPHPLPSQFLTGEVIIFPSVLLHVKTFYIMGRGGVGT